MGKKRKEIMSRLSSLAAIAVCAMYQGMVYAPVYARDYDGDPGGGAGGLDWVVKFSVPAAQDAVKTTGYILGVLLKVCEYIGSAVLLWGIINWVMATKNEDAGSKQKAIMATITGILLFTMRSILTSAGVIV